jgi:hypothetical protein
MAVADEYKLDKEQQRTKPSEEWIHVPTEK